MVTLIDWVIVLSDLLLSGNPAKIEVARTMIEYRSRERANDAFANREVL